MNPPTERAVVRFDTEHEPDFARVHCEENGAGWCQCVAWWTPTWEGWGERTAEENARLRQSLCDRGEHDGYLLYVDGEPAGWCQAGPRDRLHKLVAQFGLEPRADTWAVTCFLVAPGYRGQGLAAYLLDEVLADLRARGVARVEAFPKRGADLDAMDLWNGPEAMFRTAGFRVIVDDPVRPVLALDL